MDLAIADVWHNDDWLIYVQLFVYIGKANVWNAWLN